MYLTGDIWMDSKEKRRCKSIRGDCGKSDLRVMPNVKICINLFPQTYFDRISAGEKIWQVKPQKEI